MIQNKPRDINSSSLLRELEYARFILNNREEEKLIDTYSKEVVKKRHNPNRTYTGAKNLKRLTLNLIKRNKQKDDSIKTVNLWCRNMPLYSANIIKAFMHEVQNELRKINAIGVLELHPQDIEVNSPHIQFVGTKAEEVEDLIAKILVKKGYEINYAEAVGRKDAKEKEYYKQISQQIQEEEQVIRKSGMLKTETQQLTKKIQQDKRESLEQTLKRTIDSLRIFIDKQKKQPIEEQTITTQKTKEIFRDFCHTKKEKRKEKTTLKSLETISKDFLEFFTNTIDRTSSQIQKIQTLQEENFDNILKSFEEKEREFDAIIKKKNDE